LIAKKVNREINKDTFTENSVERNKLLPKEAFLKKHKISPKAFLATKIKWSDLLKIHDDYVASLGLLQNLATEISSAFLTDDAKEVGVHSVRSRIKKPEGLIEKIIRKTIRDKKKGKAKSITLKNYTSQITDLVGVRVLHVFKDDWYQIHNFILNTCKFCPIEDPIAYYRKGDQKSFIDECRRNGCEAKIHPKAYRSIHYVINRYPQKKLPLCEIQVRTVFEDGWSEIDHKLRYGTKTTEKHVLDSYLLALNRIAGSADEIGTIIRNRVTELGQSEYQKQLVKKKRKG
jgi:ppGpp synthetase/RelA/SpoT-type nucleotidyltranferase